jgi:hypothetical protein
MRFRLPKEIGENRNNVKKVALRFFNASGELFEEKTLCSGFSEKYIDYSSSNVPHSVTCNILYKSGKFKCVYLGGEDESAFSLQDPEEIKTARQFEIIQSLPDIEKDIILVNHNHTLNGAAHSLYTLYGYLKDSGKDVMVLDTFPNEIFFSKYNVDKPDVMYYEKDAVLLYHMCKKFYKRILLFNSINEEMANVASRFERDKIILFSRETKEYFMAKSMYFPDFVLTERISRKYPNNPKVQPPILSKKILLKIDEELKEEVVIDGLYNDKIILGMCGTLTARKNYKLFIEIALPYTPQNVFHIATTKYPFRYYKLLDYFVLFSEDEPFGNVVTENLYIGNKVLTFRENIYAEHKDTSLKNLYFEYPGKINFDNAIEHILANCTQKKTDRLCEAGREYVVKNYSDYNQEFKSIF